MPQNACRECHGSGLDHPCSYKSRNTDDNACPRCGGTGLEPPVEFINIITITPGRNILTETLNYFTEEAIQQANDHLLLIQNLPINQKLFIIPSHAVTQDRT